MPSLHDACIIMEAWEAEARDNAAAPVLVKANNQEGCELLQSWRHAKHESGRTNQGVEVVWKGRAVSGG